MERLSRSEIIFKILAYTLIGAFALAALYPVIYAFSASASGKTVYESGRVVLLPIDFNTQVYSLIFNDKGFWISYVNTMFYTVFGTAWSMFVSVTGAYALSRKRLLYRHQLNFFVVFTMWFNAGIIPMYLNYVNLHVNNRWGIVVAFGVQAFNIILLRSYFSTVPKEIEEAGLMDGVNEFQLLGRIFLPMSRAALATITLFYATTRWNGYFWARILLTNPLELPLQVYMRIIIENYQATIDDMGDLLPFAADSYVYAIMVCGIIPVLIVYPYIQKHFSRGVNLGGVKG